MSTTTDPTTPTFGFPFGAAPQLWFSFATAAATGAAWFWWSRWREFSNIEAFMARTASAVATPTRSFAPPEDTPADIAFGSAVDHMPAIKNPELDPEVVLGLVEAEPPAADDLVRIVGIGPKLAAALAAEGVRSFAQLAAWTAEDLEHFDKALDLKGRAARDAWIAQARRLAGGD